jgi:predicted nucleic-acid-binding Zn-ribbon protein
MQAAHQPFSGDDPLCPKCLKIGATTEYMRWGECTHGRLNEVVGYDTNERLHRECLRCGYSWDEDLAAAVADPPCHAVVIKIGDLEKHLAGIHGLACAELHREPRMPEGTK